MAYKPAMPFSVAMQILIPTTVKKSGVVVKTFTEGSIFNGSFRTFGGTDVDNNGILTVEDTATINTWFRPDIKSDCRIKVLSTGRIYSIIGTPENIELRNQYLSFRVRAVGGEA